MDTEWLLRARKGDREAITQLVLTHQGVVRSYLARLAPDPVTADDLAQEVFLAALKSLERVNPEFGLRPYLLAIARNLSRTAWSRRLQHPEISGNALFETLEAGKPDQEAAGRADLRLAALQECLGRLAPKAMEVIQRHYRDEQSCMEIAQQIGAAESTVRSILTRTRHALRECIEPKLLEAAS